MAATEPSPETSDTSAPPTPPASEPVWSFRGYALRPREFTEALVNYYRAEIERSNAWRGRLDDTTNWAVIGTGASILFTLASPTYHYGVIIFTTLLVTLFLWIEARRYRYYELWSYRARLMETDFFAAMLVPPFAPHPEWAESLAESLLQPEFPISMWEAFGRRFRRNYLWIYLVLGLAWAVKIYLHPTPATAWSEFVARAGVGPLPGEVVLLAGLVYNGALFLIGLLTAGLHQATGEVLPKYGGLGLGGPRAAEARPAAEAGGEPGPIPAADLPIPGRRRQQLLALIITAQPEAVAQRVLKEMRRGVTALHGRGMYSGQERDVLMIALTVTEMARLKALVREADPNAFVVVSPAQEVLGRGFQPLGR